MTVVKGTSFTCWEVIPERIYIKNKLYKKLVRNFVGIMCFNLEDKSSYHQQQNVDTVVLLTVFLCFFFKSHIFLYTTYNVYKKVKFTRDMNRTERTKFVLKSYDILHTLLADNI